MNANGTYSGLDGGAVNGVYNGVNSGVDNGVISNETKPLNTIQLLDLFPNAAAAYSLRKLRKQYSGPAIRVRRSSDNAEQDVGFDINGNLNEIQLRGFIGTSDGFVSVWYDQSENGRNASQSTQAGQPRIALNGVIDRESGDISLIFDGSNDNLVAASTSGLTISATSFYSVSSRRNTSNALRTVFSTGILSTVTGYGIFYADNTNFLQQDKIAMQSRYTSGTFNVPGYYTNTINTNNLLFGITKITGNNLWYNGGSETSSTFTETNTTTGNNIFIGSNGNPSFYHNGSIQEIVIWQLDQSSKRTAIEQNINSYYKIY